MESVNFVVLGEQSAAGDLGKKGSSSDLTIYDRKESGVTRTYITPNGFPEKIQPLFQAIGLAEYAIVHVACLDRFVGEQMIALDTLGVREGILCHTYDVDEGRLHSMIRGTVLDGYRKAGPDEMRAASDRLRPAPGGGPAKVVIDHCFDVKGAGTVVLGKVVSGVIRQYQNMRVWPQGTEVMIKSIQMHDDPVDEAHSPARVGLSLKGIAPDMVGRGDVMCGEDLETRTQIELDFEKNPFYTGDYAANQMCLASIGVQIRPARFASTDPVRLVLDRPAVCSRRDVVAVLKPDSSPVRILGSGTVK